MIPQPPVATTPLRTQTPTPTVPQPPTAFILQQPAQQQYNPQQPGQQQHTLLQYPLQQNGSAERSRGVVIPKEELDETLKEEIIETSDEDKTRADISGSRQVDSGGNQDKSTNQTKSLER